MELPSEIAAHKLLLWVGGTDRRHGFDIALQVMDRLPDTYHLIAKQSAYYPEAATDHPQVTVIRDDLPSLAPLMRRCDMMLHTARGVGFSLPVLEALACGLPVVSTDLPPIREYAPPGRVAFATAGQWVPMGRHHLHDDCLPVWWEPDVDDLAATVQGFEPTAWNRAAFIKQWSWDAAAQRLLSVLKGEKVNV
jgi:glycosyltransferase involved in cell wall biosynthesis